MPMVRFATDLNPAELPNALRQMSGIVGWSTWQQRIDSLRSELANNPVWERFLRERHGLELAFGEIHRHLRSTGRFRWPPKTAEEYRLYSFLAGAVRIYPRLSAAGQARFAGALRTGLDKEFGLGPLAFEVKVAVHLISRGFEVDFHDLETGGGFDLLAVSGATRIEVECKHISADIGRQIHRRKLYALSGVLRQPMEQAIGQGGGQGRLLQVTLPGRLSGNKAEQQSLADRIDAVLTDQAAVVDDRVCTVSARAFSLQSSPFSRERSHGLTMDDIQQYLKESFGIDNTHVLSHWRPGHAAILTSFESRRPDRILDQIFKRLKADAKKQFSRTLPAFLCVHLADVTEPQLLELANADSAGTVTGLQRAASILLQIRPHLHSIAMMTDGNVQMTRERSGNVLTTSVQELGPSYVFRNPDHPIAGNMLLDQVFF